MLKLKSCASVPIPSCKLDKFKVFPFEIAKVVPVKETVCASVLSKYPDKSTGVPSFVKLKVFVLKLKSCASVPIPSCKLDKSKVFPFEIAKVVPVKETVCASILSKYPDKSIVVPSFVKLKVFVLKLKSCASVLSKYPDKSTVVPSFVKLKVFVLKVKSCASVLSKYPDKSIVVTSFVKLKVFVVKAKSCASVLLPDIHCVPSQENNPFMSVS